MEEDTVAIPRHINDKFYRYQMPKMETTITGKHQASDTRILNLQKIANALKRDTEYIMKFFEVEMRSRTACDDKTQTYSIHGKYSTEDVAQALDKFIDTFVLCGSESCRLPECHLEISQNRLRLNCDACATIAYINDYQKVITYILKHPSSNVLIASDDDERRNQQQVVDYQWSVPTSKDAVQHRKAEAHGHRKKKQKTDDLENDIKDLSEFVLKEPTVDDFIGKVQVLQFRYNWSNSNVIMTLFKILFDENILYEIDTSAKYVEPFVCTQDDQRLFLLCIEMLCALFPDLIKNIPSILQGFYVKDVITEDTCNIWKRKIIKKVDVKVAKEVRRSAKPFFDWLKEATSPEQ